MRKHQSISNTTTLAAEQIRKSVRMAEYFHTTLYQFERDAFTEVIRQFKEAVPDVSARCWYDVEQDVSDP